MVRPLYRWKSFWFGLLVLAFIGWGWVRSMNFREVVGWEHSRGEVIMATQAGGTLGFSRFAGFPINRGFFHEISLDSFPTWFPRGTWKLFENSGRATEIGIPHWFLILLFLVPWAGFLVWRVRRGKRLAAGSAEPPARRMVP